MKLSQFTFSIVLSGFIFVGLMAQASGIEYYTERPNILSLQPEVDAQKNWDRIRWAQVEFVAQLLGLYPTETLYFLARDGEYPYDLALLLTQKYPKLSQRLKLINVSRGNQNSPNLREYLIQEGLTEKLIEKDGVVFVDTGYEGSIGKLIRSMYPQALHSKMRIHLIESDVEDIPESKIFHTKQSMGAEDFEGMPRFNYRSDNIVYHRGQWIPTSPSVSEGFKDDEGEVSKRRALKYMQGTIAFAQNPAVMELFETRLRQWNYSLQYILDDSKTLREVREFTSEINRKWEDKAKNAFVTDFGEFFSFYANRKLRPEESFFHKTKKWVPAWNQLLQKWQNDPEGFVKAANRTDILDLAYLMVRHYDSQGVKTSLSLLAAIVDQMYYAQIKVFFGEIENLKGAVVREEIKALLLKDIRSPAKIWKRLAKADSGEFQILKCRHLFLAN